MPEHDTDNKNPEVKIPSSIPSEAWLTENVTNPGLAMGTEQAFVAQTIDEDKELLQQPAGQIPVTPKAERDTVASATVQAGTAQDAVQQPDIEAEIVKTEDVDRAVAETGTVPPEATVQGQLEQLMGDIDSGDAPWADAAMRRANQAMSARGMGNSSMAAAAITQAVLESALPIAQYDAGVYGTMNLQNLRNRQEAMLSASAASNVALNMNAQSVNDVNKFMATMQDNVVKFNATQQNAMSQFNAAQSTDVSKVNAAANNIASQFYTQMDNQAEQFNANNTLAVAKSNAEWRRTINTANTASENTANMMNAQNLFNISQQSLANLWQQSRDVFKWANENAESEKDRAFNVALYSIQRADFLQDMDNAQRQQIQDGMGNLVFDLFKGVAGNYIKGLKLGNTDTGLSTSDAGSVGTALRG